MTASGNLASVKKQVDYAKSKGIEVGGYDLIVLDRNTYTNHATAKVEPMPVNMSTLPAGSGCMASAWYVRRY